jgi:multidrug transporter EmrE-like cation transporter
MALSLYAFGEWLSKRWALEQTPFNWSLALLAYTVSCAGWLGIMAHTNKLTLMSTLWEIGCLLLAAVIGVVIYGERLTPMQWVGFFLAIIAGILLAG